MEITQYIIGIFVVTGLTTGWIGVQLLARKMGTKNHFDQPSASCSDFGKSCDCGSGGCGDEKLCER